METFIQMITDRQASAWTCFDTVTPHHTCERVCVGFDKRRLFLLPSERVLSSHFPRPGLSSEASQDTSDPSSTSKALWTFEGKYDDTTFMASTAPRSPILNFEEACFRGYPLPHLNHIDPVIN